MSPSLTWVTPQHPDPDAEQLALLARVASARIKYREQNPIDDTAMFFDWCCLYQNPRSEEELAAFKVGLHAVNLWYGHKLVEKWLLTALPKSAPAAMLPYEKRGWPTFERQVCSLISSWDTFLDLGFVEEADVDYADIAQKCEIRKRPLPSLPSEFAPQLAKTTFTNKADHEFVEKKYAKTLEEILGTATALNFEFRGWNGAQATRLAQEFLPHCHKLEQLRIGDNPIGDAGAAAIVAKLPAAVWQLQLENCGLSDAGLRTVLAGVRHCKSLLGLQIGWNKFSDDGAEAIAAAIPEMRELGMLQLASTEMTEQGKQQIAQAWEDAGKDAGYLRFE